MVESNASYLSVNLVSAEMTRMQTIPRKMSFQQQHDQFLISTDLLDMDHRTRNLQEKKTRYSLETNQKCEYDATVQIDIHSDFDCELRF